MKAAPARFDEVGQRHLAGWARLFVSRPSPWIIAALLASALAARAMVGGVGWADLAVAAALVALEPFTEWLIHVGILHFRPRQAGRRRIDLPVARAHRAHHRDPAHIGLIFVPLDALAVLAVLFAALTLAVLRTPGLWLTALVTGYMLLLAYEWTHYLIHSPYVPRTALYRRVWRAHRLHHFKNEHYWFGITSHVADRVLRTFPDRASVETSPTARSLHGEAASATT